MADIIVLNENHAQSNETLQALQQKVSQDFYIPLAFDESSKKRFHCFCKRKTLGMAEIHAFDRISVREFKIGSHRLLLALVHGIDMRNHDPATRQSFAQKVADSLRFVKEQQNTSKMIILGDFNMNPYDRGMNLAAGLNAMMMRDCIQKGSRTYHGEQYEFYYNPMWSLLGDNTPGPAGTIYNTSSQGAYGWSTLDQVLINHSIVKMFHNVEIMTHAGEFSLMNSKDRPDSKNASDHFPILVKLNGD